MLGECLYHNAYDTLTYGLFVAKQSAERCVGEGEDKKEGENKAQ